MMAKSCSKCLVLLALLATVCLSTGEAETTATTTSTKCPQQCTCEFNSTIRCTSVIGLRSLDKSLPIARLDLSGLELTKVPVVLENVRNITELDLSDNRLAEVNHLGKRIRKLDLSHNRITSAKLARIPPFVESLNLTYNDITYLPLHLMKLKRLRYIELANNPINCTCETLHIRNWLTSRHVWSDEHIKCMAPAEFKGQPWLQVRQFDVCNPSVVEERKEGYRWDDYEDDNELMLGDAAHHEVNDQDEDDFKREYLPVGEKVKRNEPPIVVDNYEDEDGSGGGPAIGEKSAIGEEERRKVFEGPADEGSGEDAFSDRVIEPAVDDGEGDEDLKDDGSSSGGGMLMGFGHISHEDPHSTMGTTTEPPIDDGHNSEEEPDEPPMESPSINEGLGIFRKDEDDVSPETDSTETTSEATNARVMIGAAGIMKTASETGNIGGSHHPSSETPLVEDGATVATQSEEDNQKTYLLLAVLGIIVVSLIVMVVCKRKPDSRNRRGKYDVETANGQGREMKEMNKNLLEKGPGERNGHGGAGAPEQTPLMSPDKPDFERVFGDPQKTAFSPVKPVRTSLEKPMESFKPIAAERRMHEPVQGAPATDNNNTTGLPNGNGALHNGDAPAGVHKPNHVPSTNGDVTDPDGHLAVPMESPRSKRYSPIYVPTSPKSDRYSPVYSPETGRVKIKLTETPKPKTPILVTRSRSRAGDIITTMDDQKF